MSPKRDCFNRKYIWTNHWFSRDMVVFQGVKHIQVLCLVLDFEATGPSILSIISKVPLPLRPHDWPSTKNKTTTFSLSNGTSFQLVVGKLANTYGISSICLKTICYMCMYKYTYVYYIYRIHLFQFREYPVSPVGRAVKLQGNKTALLG